jgi:hypothetical protein
VVPMMSLSFILEGTICCSSGSGVRFAIYEPFREPMDAPAVSRGDIFDGVVRADTTELPEEEAPEPLDDECDVPDRLIRSGAGGR